MAEHPIVTVEELQRMSPAERVALLEQRAVTDLSQVDPEFLARAKADVMRVLRERQALDPRPR